MGTAGSKKERTLDTLVRGYATGEEKTSDIQFLRTLLCVFFNLLRVSTADSLRQDILA